MVRFVIFWLMWYGGELYKQIIQGVLVMAVFLPFLHAFFIGRHCAYGERIVVLPP